MPSIEISQETYDEIVSIFSLPLTDPISSKSFPAGKLFIRTVTYHAVGQVVGQIGEFIELANASCVFNSGSLSDAALKGTLQESEFVGKMFVNRNSITDMFPWKHDLPKTSK
jgi:hypothetical protein